MEVSDYAAHLLAVEQAAEHFRAAATSVTEAALRDDALKTSGR